MSLECVKIVKWIFKCSAAELRREFIRTRRGEPELNDMQILTASNYPQRKESIINNSIKRLVTETPINYEEIFDRGRVRVARAS
jgi:hypothetical protein